LASVHEDQGSTHGRVVTLRTRADYDKNSARDNPSLYNRLNYVLTDMTRHTDSYHYYTTSEEEDMIIKRVKVSKDSNRLRLVNLRMGMGLTSLNDMLNNTYHQEIVNGKSLR